MSTHDLQLINASQKGDKEAFNQLVLRHQDRVYNTALRFTGNTHDAFDIAQQTFLNAYRNISSFKGEASFTTWLHRIAFNSYISSKRKNKHETQISVNDEGKSYTEEISREEHHHFDEKDKVQRILLELTPDDRKLIILKDIEGYKYREIADLLNMPEGSVHGRIHRIRLFLRDRFKSTEHF